jgi:hypothetical protein
MKSVTLVIVSRSVIHRVRNVSDRFVEEVKTRFVISNFFTENLALYEIMWKNTVERGRPQVTLNAG